MEDLQVADYVARERDLQTTGAVDGFLNACYCTLKCILIPALRVLSCTPVSRFHNLPEEDLLLVYLGRVRICQTASL